MDSAIKKFVKGSEHVGIDGELPVGLLHFDVSKVEVSY